MTLNTTQSSGQKYQRHTEKHTTIKKNTKIKIKIYIYFKKCFVNQEQKQNT